MHNKMKNLNKVEHFFFQIIFPFWICSIPFKNAIFQISTSLLAIAFIYHAVKRKNTGVIKNILKEVGFLASLFIGFICCMLLSNSLNTEYLVDKSWHYAYMYFIRYGVIFVALCYLYQQKIITIKHIYVLMFVAFTLVMCTGFHQLITNPSILKGQAGIKGALDNRNAFGLAMGMGLTLSITLLNHKKYFALLFITIFLFFMIFSFSRSSWVATTCAFGVFFIVNIKSFKWHYLIYFLLFMVFLCILYFSFESFQHRLQLLIEGNSSNRTTIWSHLLTQISHQPFIGYGIKTQVNLPDSYLKQFPDPHNLILETLLYTGVLGMLFLTGILTTLARQIVKNNLLYLLPVFTYFIVVTQFDFDIFTSKELMSFFTIFTFFIYADKVKHVS